MAQIEVVVSQAVGVAAVVYTMLCLWWSVLLLGVVAAAVVAMCRYVERRATMVLPAAGRVVLITGCDTGIGHETAVAASQRGLTVVAGCLDRLSPGAERLANMKRVHVIPLDVTDDESIQSALRDVTKMCGEKGLWAVVNNAGLNHQAPVELTSRMTFQRLADVMLCGTVHVTKAFLPLVRRAKGRVVTMSSDRGMLSPSNSAAYCITKHGVEAFSDVLRSEMEEFGVSVSIMQVGHFGGATAIINDDNVEAMRKSLERDLQECSPEVQQAYGGGQRAVKAVIDMVVASRDNSPSDVMPVVKAMLHSLLSSHPADRYPVQGTSSFVDFGIVLGQIRPFVPGALFRVVQAFLWRY